MSVISFEEARTLTLARLRQWLKEVPVAERSRPRIIIDFKPYSILDLIREVEQGTDVGRKYVYDTAKKLGYAVS